MKKNNETTHKEKLARKEKGVLVENVSSHGDFGPKMPMVKKEQTNETRDQDGLSKGKMNPR